LQGGIEWGSGKVLGGGRAMTIDRRPMSAQVATETIAALMMTHPKLLNMPSGAHGSGK